MTCEGGDIMQSFTINGQTITFDAKKHHYYVDTQRIASIGEIVEKFMPRKPVRVDKERMQNAAQKGVDLRERIVAYEINAFNDYHVELQRYIALKRQHQFDVKATNILVALHDQGKIIAAGKMALLVESPYIKGTGIADIKRMQHLDLERLRLQLNLYKLAYEQTYKKRLTYIKCIHIRHHKKDYVDIPIDKSVAEKALAYYLASSQIDTALWMK